MKTLIFILIILAFLQTTIIPMNLVLIVLICRAYVKDDQYNLLLAFGFGLLISHLTLTPLGVYSICFLSLTWIAKLLSNTRFTANSLFVMLVVFLSVLIDLLVTSWMTSQSLVINFQLILGSLLSLPVFYLVRLWEERYIIRKDIKLKF